MDRPVDAEAYYRKGLTIHEVLARAHPTVTEHILDRGKSYGRLGHLFKTRSPQAALEWFDRAAGMHETILSKQPHHVEARTCLGYVHSGRARALMQLRRYAEALENWEQALRFDDGRETTWRCLQRAATRARLGQHTAAAAEADAVAEKARVAKPADGSGVYGAACVYAVCSLAVGQDAELPSTERSSLAERYAVHAVELLTKARADGYFQVSAKIKHMNSDPDLEPLRAREDFKKLVKELADKSVVNSP
jgi:tetratricopeptide (TPR) repeat protein